MAVGRDECVRDGVAVVVFDIVPVRVLVFDDVPVRVLDGVMAAVRVDVVLYDSVRVFVDVDVALCVAVAVALYSDSEVTLAQWIARNAAPVVYSRDVAFVMAADTLVTTPCNASFATVIVSTN